MLFTDPSPIENSDTQEAMPGFFSSAYVIHLHAEIEQMRAEIKALQEQAITDRRDAHYYKSMHGNAVVRLQEMDGHIEALKSKLCELQNRLFGRKSESCKAKKIAPIPIGPKRKRGQQPDAAGHGRKVHDDLPVVELEVLPPEDQIFCAHCNKPWIQIGEPEVCNKIEWEVHVVRTHITRPKFRRPEGCTCQDGRPDIVCAPPPASLIAKGLLGISFIVQALLLKFAFGIPANKILSMVAIAGLKLSAGTLCGVFKQIAPLFVPIYEGILAYSRQQDLVLMDETRWEVFEETEGKLSYRWWLWVVVTNKTRLYILSPSRSSAVPKEYFGYDEESKTHTWHKQAMTDRYSAYSFLKSLLDSAYCWAHVRRDFFDERSEEKDREWAESWIARIAEIYSLNKVRIELGCVLNPTPLLPAPFVEIDAERINTPVYLEANKLLHEAVEKMATARSEELEDKHLRSPRRKVLQSLERYWHGLTLFVDHPEIPMDNNGAERIVRPAVVARKNFYGSGAKWSGELMVMLMSIFQTLHLHLVNPHKYLTAYLKACADNGSKAPENIEPWLPWNYSTQESSTKKTVELPLDAPGPAP